MLTREESERVAAIVRSTPRYFGLTTHPDEVFTIDTENCRREGNFVWFALQRFAYTTWKPHGLLDERSFKQQIRELAPGEYCGLTLSYSAPKEYGDIQIDAVRLVDDEHVLVEGVLKRAYRERSAFQDEGVSLDGERVIVHKADRRSLRTGAVLFVE